MPNKRIMSLITGEKTDDDPPSLSPEFSDDEPMPADPKPRKTHKPAASRAPATKVKAVRDELGALLMLGSAAVSARDPFCGGVLNQQASDIADALADILATKPALMAWFEQATGMGGYMKLFMAVMPVVQAFAAHHISHSVNEESDDARANPIDDFPPYYATAQSA